MAAQNVINIGKLKQNTIFRINTHFTQYTYFLNNKKINHIYLLVYAKNVFKKNVKLFNNKINVGM